MEKTKDIPEVVKIADLQKLMEYMVHDSWRCRYYQECHCGLDNLTDELNLERVPCPEKKS